MLGGKILAIFLLFVAITAGLPVRAETTEAALVGRIAAVEGSVAIRPAGGAWSDSGMNDPVAAGMAVRTGPQARALLRIGADTVALAAGSEIEVARLDAGGIQIVLRQGRLGARFRQIDPDRGSEIDLPQGSVWPLGPGDFDIAAGDDRSPGRVATLDGRAWITGKAIDSIVVTDSAGEPNGANAAVGSRDGGAADAFVAWWRSARDDAAEPPALRYVSADMTGYDALDRYGSWQSIHGFGAVWSPAGLPEGWAPYRYGHWRWLAPWGWTWIDDMPWGFATSHYGRWMRIPGADDEEPERWGWAPGDRLEHPAYMPAAVAFLGTAGVGLSYPDAFGPAVAWFPLAPGEVYWPGYTDDIDIIRRLNQGSVADLSAIGPGANGDPPAEVVNGDYLYRRFASVVPRSVFTGGRPVAAALLQLPERRLENAPLLAGSPEIAPAAPRTPVATAVAKLARAEQTLIRILKPRGGSARARVAVLARAARTPSQSHAARGRPGRPRIAAAPAHSGHARLHLAAAKRR